MTIRTTLAHRVISFLVYLALTAGGVVGLIIPPISMTETSTTVLIIIWASLMIAGGIGGVAGVVTGSLFPEIVGVPSLIGGVSVFNIVLSYRVITGNVANPSGSIIVILVMLGFTGLLVIRLIEISRLVDAVGRAE